jgi:hypothetical protein
MTHLPQSPQETPGREDFYNAALIHTTLFCEQCQAALDPDEDLGPNHSFASDGYYVLLGDEAFHRGWLVEWGTHDFRILCPQCAKQCAK